ncbi:MAG: TA system VapC family ribonuclease toxin [Pseudonocardia sp.]
MTSIVLGGPGRRCVVLMNQSSRDKRAKRSLPGSTVRREGRAISALLDANLLIALAVGDHIHHATAAAWLADRTEPFATCPITQGSLVRMLVREGRSAGEARQILVGFRSDHRHEFWPDELSYADVALTGVVGHRQVTDAYLAQLARAREGRLATFDRGLAALHPDVVDLVPTG